MKTDPESLGSLHAYWPLHTHNKEIRDFPKIWGLLITRLSGILVIAAWLRELERKRHEDRMCKRFVIGKSEPSSGNSI